MITYPYEYMYVHLTSISTFTRLTQFDLKIHEVGHQECLAVDGDIISERIISRKYIIHVKSKI
jgi:hypothetical protein